MEKLREAISFDANFILLRVSFVHVDELNIAFFPSNSTFFDEIFARLRFHLIFIKKSQDDQYFLHSVGEKIEVSIKQTAYE